MNSNLRERINAAFPDLAKPEIGIGQVYVEVKGNLPLPENVDGEIDVSLFQTGFGPYSMRFSEEVYSRLHPTLIGEGVELGNDNYMAWALIAGSNKFGCGNLLPCGMKVTPHGEIFVAQYNVADLGLEKALGMENSEKMGMAVFETSPPASRYLATCFGGSASCGPGSSGSR